MTDVHLDSFGNTVAAIHVPRVEHEIDFEAWIVVERRAGGAETVDLSAPNIERLLVPSPLTEPDSALREAAETLQRGGTSGLALAREINHWVYQHIRYAHDSTDIHTTAREALQQSIGVCQDFAHVMLALCRLCGIPCRYVSGHLLGEGGTHAWVEVLHPEGGGYGVWPFDPTHDREPGMSYVTVAVGRDYSDVAPTSGTFRAGYGGRLSARKRVGLTEVHYAPVE